MMTFGSRFMFAEITLYMMDVLDVWEEYGGIKPDVCHEKGESEKTG